MRHDVFELPAAKTLKQGQAVRLHHLALGECGSRLVPVELQTSASKLTGFILEAIRVLSAEGLRALCI